MVDKSVTRKIRVAAGDREEDKMFLRQCIELYRSMPVLWKVKSEEYRDRDKRAQAMEHLLDFYKQRYPVATEADLKRKLNSLRTNFRKDLKKLNDSKKSGAGRDDVYVPSCWYFEDMYFLVDQETPSESINTMDDKDSEPEDDINSYCMEELHVEETQYFETNQCQPIVTKQIRKKKKTEDPTNELLRLAVDRLQKPNNDHLHIATSWAQDLSRMEPTQQVLAKKFINDIIFEGQMNALHRNSVIINQTVVLSPVFTDDVANS